jgi:hypothetical protein
MEIDRVQLVKGLKIERTGSEQERRRRQQSEERFEDLLESTLDGDEQPERQAREDAAEPPSRDTVSISRSAPLSPLVNDLVSISTAARVTAEVHNAGRRDGDPSKIERELRRHQLPEPPDADNAEEAEEDYPPRDSRRGGRRVDTLA